jgi:regulator of cell morphogenesis and NO signaling
MTVPTSQTLGDLVEEAPDRVRVLDRLGLDYCCHGRRSLADACAEAGLDPAAVAGELDAVAVTPGGPDHPTEPAALSEHIEAVHHAYLHAELPALVALADKVATVHGDRHPELALVRRLVGELQLDLEPHLLKEERILFPAIRALVAGHRDLPFGTVRNPIRMMTSEHDGTAELLARLRAAAGGYEVPDDGCASYRALYDRLDHLEADTRLHLHLEGNVLFPAAVAVEAGSTAVEAGSTAVEAGSTAVEAG